MKRECALLLALGLGALTASAESTPATTPALNLPSLENTGTQKKLIPNQPLFPSNNNNSILPNTPAPIRPRPAVTGSASPNKDWLVNGVLEFQKKQQEERELLRQQQRENSSQLYQQELDKQQKSLLGINNPLDPAKLSDSVFHSGSASALTSIDQLNLPNGRLNLSGTSDLSAVTVSGLPGLSEPAQTGNFQLPENSPSQNLPAYAPASYAPAYNNAPSPVLNNQPSWNPAQWNSNPVVPATPAASQLPDPAIANLTPFASATMSPLQPPVPPTFTPPILSGSMPGANPFTPAQAANYLNQLDNRKSPVKNEPARPTVQDLKNGISTPANMKRF